MILMSQKFVEEFTSTISNSTFWNHIRQKQDVIQNCKHDTKQYVH